MTICNILGVCEYGVNVETKGPDGTWHTDTEGMPFMTAVAIAKALREVQQSPGGSVGGGTDVRVVTFKGRVVWP